MKKKASRKRDQSQTTLLGMMSKSTSFDRMQTGQQFQQAEEAERRKLFEIHDKMMKIQNEQQRCLQNIRRLESRRKQQEQQNRRNEHKQIMLNLVVEVSTMDEPYMFRLAKGDMPSEKITYSEQFQKQLTQFQSENDVDIFDQNGQYGVKRHLLNGDIHKQLAMYNISNLPGRYLSGYSHDFLKALKILENTSDQSTRSSII